MFRFIAGSITEKCCLTKLQWAKQEHRTRDLMTEPHVAQKSPFVQKAAPATYWWCACGLSKTQPFCDGSHKSTGFAPRKVDITEEKTVAWCGCKHSKNAPFCDGSHSKLA